MFKLLAMSLNIAIFYSNNVALNQIRSTKNIENMKNIKKMLLKDKIVKFYTH
jgi:hypothetical protein